MIHGRIGIPNWIIVHPVKDPGYRLAIVTVDPLFVDLDFSDEVAVFTY